MKDAAYYKEKLENELQNLKVEMATVGAPNPDAPGDWEAKPENIDINDADPNESADRIESQQENQAILSDFETRYKNVAKALKKIEEGVFGTCEVCKKEIEEDRLGAIPSARTCKEHRDNERELPL